MTDNSCCQIVLASASPRRRELLQQIGISFQVYAVDIDESYTAGESATEHVLRLALAKAQSAYNQLLQQANTLPVLAADTVVEIGGEVLGKPVDNEHARSMLARLSGREHNVHTAVAVVTEHDQLTAISSSVVDFAELDEAVIAAYIASGEPADKAGGYGIQGIAGQFVRSIKGSYSGIMGLPLFETVQLLQTSGVQIMRTTDN